MSVALGKLPEQRGIELELASGLHGIETILFVDRLPPHDRPTSGALGEEVVEPSRANSIDDHAVDGSALIDRHLGLSDRSFACDLDGGAAEEVNDVYAAFETRAARFLKLDGGSVKPRGRHPGVVVPHRREALPIAGIAPEHPV